MNPPTITARPPRCWRRRLLRTAIVLASLIVLFYVEENWRGTRAWDRVRADLEARGEPLDWEHYLKQVPDDENFFAAPIVQEKYFGPHPDWLDFKDGGSVGEALGVAWADENHCDLPVVLQWLRAHATWPLPAETGKLGADILAVLAPADAGLKALSEATRRPQAELLPSQATEHGMALGFRAMMETGRLYDLRRLALLHDGRTAEACDECLQAIRFVRQLSARPTTLMQYLLSCACAGVAIGMLRDTAGTIPWNVEQLQALEQELSALHFADRFQEALRGERVFMLALLHSWSTDKMMVVGRGLVTIPLVARLYPSGWKQKWMASTCDAIQQMIDGIAKHGLRGEIGCTLEAGWFPPQPFADVGKSSDGALVGYRTIMRHALAQDAAISIARVSLAATRWRLETGKLPAALVELAEYFPAGIPNDPLTDQPLRYEVRPDGGYTVSSPGRNEGSPDDDIAWKIPPPAINGTAPDQTPPPQ